MQSIARARKNLAEQQRLNLRNRRAELFNLEDPRDSGTASKPLNSAQRYQSVRSAQLNPAQRCPIDSAAQQNWKPPPCSGISPAPPRPHPSQSEQANRDKEALQSDIQHRKRHLRRGQPAHPPTSGQRMPLPARTVIGRNSVVASPSCRLSALALPHVIRLAPDAARPSSADSERWLWARPRHRICPVLSQDSHQAATPRRPPWIPGVSLIAVGRFGQPSRYLGAFARPSPRSALRLPVICLRR